MRRTNQVEGLEKIHPQFLSKHRRNHVNKTRESRLFIDDK